MGIRFHPQITQITQISLRTAGYSHSSKLNPRNLRMFLSFHTISPARRASTPDSNAYRVFSLYRTAASDNRKTLAGPGGCLLSTGQRPLPDSPNSDPTRPTPE